MTQYRNILAVAFAVAVLFAACGESGPKGEIQKTLDEYETVVNDTKQMIESSDSFEAFMEKYEKSGNTDKLTQLQTTLDEQLEKHEAELSKEDLDELQKRREELQNKAADNERMMGEKFGG
jgi:5'-deoxynucleotidase YfbR-like HD superfamily hydrolase